MIIVTDPARARPDGTPSDIDREMAALFMIFDESNMPDYDNDEPDERPANSPTGPVKRTWAETAQFTEEGERHTINGRAFGNLAGLDMNVGERVRWYMFGLGSEKDFHTAHWHGQRVLEDGRRGTDVVELLPGTMKIADMRADNPGQWLLHCHVADHMSGGMFARFTVHPDGVGAASRDPENAFFGMPQALQTLRIQRAELVRDGDSREIDLEGQVTVRDPFPIARNPISVGIGGKTITFQPDGSGVCVTPEAMLVVKNAPPYGNGNVIGGLMKFELILKGQGWLDELRRLGLLDGDALAPNTALPLTIQAGASRHSASVPLKIAKQ
jgi:Multicopper oxidase